jgi:hypothetical protein
LGGAGRAPLPRAQQLLCGFLAFGG